MIYERIDIFTSIEVLHNVHVPLHLNLNIQQFLVCVDRRNFTCCTSWTLTKKIIEYCGVNDPRALDTGFRTDFV